MNEVLSLVRPRMLSLKPYQSARSDFAGAPLVALDANENPHGPVYGKSFDAELHRYPDPLHLELRKRISAWRGVETARIMVGNGSDEAIDLLMRIFCEPGRDAVLVTPPTYPMYQVSADINGVAVVRAPLGAEFAVDVSAIKKALTPAVKIIFICSPNNPTGSIVSRDTIAELLTLGRMVVVDEAYIDFTPQDSALPLISKAANVAVLQTFSKAWGLAGARVGMVFAAPEIIDVLYRIKAPYNVNRLSQRITAAALDARAQMEAAVKTICSDRERLAAALTEVPGVECVYPSKANFLLVKMADARLRYEELCKEGVVVRDRSSEPGCEGTLRITVGTARENEILLKTLRGERAPQAAKGNGGRSASVMRKTAETGIFVKVALDGAGRAEIDTGIGFFDHMLDQLALHSGIDLTIRALGDLKVDEHHTVEDCAIALGEALAQAWGDKRGIERFVFVLPMDEASAKVSIDLSGRAALVWEVPLRRERVGEMPCEMVPHFFRSLAENGKFALHVTASGENEHHIVEAVFKSFARALKQAIARAGAASELPSTKGAL
jgi:histidinol-phosphate aminotransferase